MYVSTLPTRSTLLYSAPAVRYVTLLGVGVTGVRDGGPQGRRRSVECRETTSFFQVRMRYAVEGSRLDVQHGPVRWLGQFGTRASSDFQLLQGTEREGIGG